MRVIAQESFDPQSLCLQSSGPVMSSVSCLGHYTVLFRDNKVAFSNIRRVTLLTAGVQREALMRRQEAPNNNREFAYTKDTYGFMSKHICIHGADMETDAIVLQIKLFFREGFSSCTLLSAVAQALTIL